MCTDIVCYLKYYKCNTFFRIFFDTKAKKINVKAHKEEAKKRKSLEKKERKNSC